MYVHDIHNSQIAMVARHNSIQHIIHYFCLDVTYLSLLIGLAQVRVGLGEEGQRRNKRTSVSNKEVIEWVINLTDNSIGHLFSDMYIFGPTS